ncbi:MAG: putative peptidoglycan glycosyltransferase FtsW [Gemmatimonadota bacterium]
MTTATLRGFPITLQRQSMSGAGRGLLAITGILVLFGLLSVYSASSYVAESHGYLDSHYLFQQLRRAAVGFGLLALLSVFDYTALRAAAWPLLALSVLLLIPLILPGTEAIAPRINGARRWLHVGMTFQPSELAKIAMVVWTASLAVKKQDKLRNFRKGLLPFLVVIGLVCLLILMEPHFSAMLMIATVTGVILFSAGARIGHFVLLGSLGLPLVLGQVLGASYRWNRVMAFLNPEVTASTGGYQLRQSLIAVGSGGWFGVGYGQSSQKMAYLPEPQNDFIFSIIAEEWGFIGAGLLITLYFGWALLALRVADSAPDLFGRLLATGFGALVFVAAFAHIGVTLGLLPTTGVNLPFMSAGGTNLVMMLGATGVLLNISRSRRRRRRA